jgi:hypothetical protein
VGGGLSLQFFPLRVVVDVVVVDAVFVTFCPKVLLSLQTAALLNNSQPKLSSKNRASNPQKNESTHLVTVSGLPDGSFSNQKSQLGYIFEWKNVVIFYDRLEYLMAIWYN